MNVVMIEVIVQFEPRQGVLNPFTTSGYCCYLLPHTISRDRDEMTGRLPLPIELVLEILLYAYTEARDQPHKSFQHLSLVCKVSFRSTVYQQLIQLEGLETLCPTSPLSQCPTL
jgi:hypothetical protein